MERDVRKVLCSHSEDHMPQPEGYIEWHAWAEEMSKTHKQRRCTGCGLYTIWEPVSAQAALKTKETDHAPE